MYQTNIEAPLNQALGYFVKVCKKRLVGTSIATPTLQFKKGLKNEIFSNNDSRHCVALPIWRRRCARCE